MDEYGKGRLGWLHWMRRTHIHTCMKHSYNHVEVLQLCDRYSVPPACSRHEIQLAIATYSWFTITHIHFTPKDLTRLCVSLRTLPFYEQRNPYYVVY